MRRNHGPADRLVLQRRRTGNYPACYASRCMLSVWRFILFGLKDVVRVSSLHYEYIMRSTFFREENPIIESATAVPNSLNGDFVSPH